MMPITKIGASLDIHKTCIDQNRDQVPVCFIGDHGQTMPMKGSSIIQSHKYAHDDYLKETSNKVMSE